MLFSVIFCAALAAATPYSPSPYSHLTRRTAFTNSTEASFTESALEVDLGYSIYKGWHNASANLNIFQGFVVPLQNMAIGMSI